MKVALITNYWKESQGGGVKVYLQNLVGELTASGADVRVIFREGSDPDEVCIPGGQRLFAVRSLSALRDYGPDVISVHGGWHCLFPAVAYKLLCGCTVVQTFHTEPEEALTDRFRLFYQTLLSRCDHVTFVSERLRERTIEVWNLKFPRAEITYAGAPGVAMVTPGEVAAFRERFGIGDRRPVLLALGLTALKYKAEGLKQLIRAVNLLKEKYPGIVLVATRRGVFSPEVEEFARAEGASGHVVFTGDIEAPAVPLSFCDIYTHITLGDGLPIALLEAMAMGKPIVATPVAGIPEAIRDGESGILVPPEPAEIAGMIDYLLVNPSVARSLGKNARRTVDERFTWEKSAEKFLALFSDGRRV
ncbi:glycosyltransferase family 4 protein [Methanoculleus sp. 7T]|uniref:glycosyltransferase family 4 protein n=1 Tax=Methanoculleus sp. 7T TaxID=2937282 RepID=UPI0020BF183F|nr:glycosyltransferase family 4 protein [Methanoculleus sp. 7T]MCK8519396.1 glycosyltransferase family 4 protein [Methanoculleus sp. 7T]